MTDPVFTGELLPAGSAVPPPIQGAVSGSVPTGILERQMQSIRPQWQSKNLIDRVKRLIAVDPSSACQRLLNASIADLREKIIIAGVDIAREAAQANSLPPIKTADSIEEYSTFNIIDLSYRMGLLNRAEWRRMHRCYEIRRDLEHEDVAYEAGIEDCVYVFTTCIDAVLSRDPINVIRVADVKDIIEAAGPATATPELLEDYRQAPQQRQLEISKFLFSRSVDESVADVVRVNSFELAKLFAPITKNSVTVDLATVVQEKIGRRVVPTPLQMRVSCANGTMPYLRQAQIKAFFQSYYQRLDAIGFHWTKNAGHGSILSEFPEYGGFARIPTEEAFLILKWMTLLYMGEPGGRGMGYSRKVFYSNAGAPSVETLFVRDSVFIAPLIDTLRDDPDIQAAADASPHVASRLEDLVDLLGI